MLREPVVLESAGRAGFDRRAEPSELAELMDGPCSYEEFRACLKDLEKVNRFTSAYKPTLHFLERVVSRESLPKPLRILDVGSGGGDMLRRVAEWARHQKIEVELTGIDLNPHSTRTAQEFSAGKREAAGIRWINADIFRYDPPGGVDVVLSALFTHHLESAEVVRFIGWMEQHAQCGWFINDLHRSERAARWFRLLPIIFRWHHFIKYDGPVSLRRAFVDEDWARLLSEAGVPEGVAQLEHYPMNRLCVARLR